jgi:SSS family solute:Na+ symporter
VALLIMGYSLVGQVLPSLLASLVRNIPVNRYGAGVGMVVGAAVVTTVTLSGPSLTETFPPAPWLRDVNPGVLALVLNVIAMFAVSALTRRRRVLGLPA